MPRGLPKCPHGVTYDFDPTEACRQCDVIACHAKSPALSVRYCEHGNDINLACVMCDDRGARLEETPTPDEPAWSYR